ncbi:YcaO-like family protein [Pseudomonas khavaziana]|uniref:YcaO-like family protein n=1 Tax=Pseudomonas khavaziana TaxID=2842351 RepID=UPI001C3CE271|nr:YcaO-like family protein [Pseudomonas khavaziana]MBV4480743.1 YcaO-like family protein [Pseudomonas khavaziana]
MQRLSSSLRRRSAEETLSIITNDLAPRLGITRVTDTTWLDRIGIPVFASIRPDALKGSLCVNAGKGLRPAEAKIGAYMEAIEFSLAQYNTAQLTLVESTPRQLIDSHEGRIAFNQFCMLYGFSANADALIMAIEVEDVLREKKVLAPAELVFIPYPENPGQQLFGESSSGLASGNDLVEASVHAMCELMERDVQAFNHLHDRSCLVHLDQYSAEIAALISKVNDAGLSLSVRYTENCFGLAYFQAFIMEESPQAPISVATGSGLHPIKEIALIRAICEAAQSRLSHIHGGRDDIIERVKYFEKKGRSVELEAISRLRNVATSREQMIDYSAIDCQEAAIPTIEAAWTLLIERLQAIGLSSVLRVVLSKATDDITVVRIMIPGLETFEPGLKRVGPRLLTYVKQSA